MTDREPVTHYDASTVRMMPRREVLCTPHDLSPGQKKTEDKVAVSCARCEKLREGIRWLLPLLDPNAMTPTEQEVYAKLKEEFYK